MLFLTDVLNLTLRDFVFKTRIMGFTLIFFGASCLGISYASARTLDEIIQSHSFSICASQEDLPFSAKNSSIPGFYIEIAQKIADSLGVELKVDWIPSREQIRYTKCDAVMGEATFDNGNSLVGIEKKTIKPKILTIPYMMVSSVLVLPNRNHEIHSMGDLKNLHVAVPSGSISHKLLNDSGVPVWVRFRNDVEIIDAVLSGQADAGVVSQVGLGWYRTNNPHTDLTVISNVLTDPELQFKVAIGLRRTNVETVTRVNEILRKLMNDGVIPEILRKYGTKFAPT